MGKNIKEIYVHTNEPRERDHFRAIAYTPPTSAHIDIDTGDDLRELTINKDYSPEGRVTNIRNAQMIVEYLHNNGCDVVVSLVAPPRWLRDEFKERIGIGDFQEIYVHCSEPRERDHFHSKAYEPPISEFMDVDTTKDSPDTSFSKIINILTKTNKL